MLLYYQRVELLVFQIIDKVALMENIISQLKQYNRLLNTIRCNPGISKNALAEKFEVSWPTMSNTIDNCRKAGILSSDGILQINSDYAHMIGISVGSAQTKLCIINMNFHRIDSNTFKKLTQKLNIFNAALQYMNKKNITLEDFVCFETPNSLFELQSQLDLIMEDVIKIIENQRSYQLNIISIGLTFTGAVDNVTKKIIKSHNLEFISDKPLSNIIFPNRINFFESKKINLYIDNNSTSSAIAEKFDLYNPLNNNYKYRNNKNIVVIYLGAGIGAGMILNNKLYRGASNFIGELGHIEVPCCPDINTESIINELCSCGNKNCLDLLIRRDVFGKTKADFSLLSTEDIDIFLKDHPDKAKILAYYIGSITNLLINILNVDLIIFTGKFKQSLNQMWLPLYQQLNTNKLTYISNECTLISSNLGVISPSIGVAISSYYDKIQEEIEW